MNRNILAPLRHDPTESRPVWILAGLSDSPGDELTIIHPTPFSVGRGVGCSLQIPSKTVSAHHADLTLQGEDLFVSDLGSTNGTYINGRRLWEPCKIEDGDVLQFADSAFRVKLDAPRVLKNTVCEDLCDQALALVQFDRLMENRLVTPHFQPIFRLPCLQVLGYEVLARSQVFGLKSSSSLFGAAGKLNLEVELSQMLRWEGIREGLEFAPCSEFYVNTHPLELSRPGLLESMQQLREMAPNLPLVLEIHEAAVTDVKEMVELRSALRDLNIQLAYDDFGAGQNRLMDLCAAPPDVLKFDMGLIRDIDKASLDRVKLLATLVQIALDMGITPLAEGIETEGEAHVCSELGFGLVQGYFFGRPVAIYKQPPTE